MKGGVYRMLTLVSQLPCRMPVSSASEERGDSDAVREKGTVEVVVT